MASSDEGEQKTERLIFGIFPWQFHALALIILAFRWVILPGLLASNSPWVLPLLPRKLKALVSGCCLAQQAWAAGSKAISA